MILVRFLTGKEFKLRSVFLEAVLIGQSIRRVSAPEADAEIAGAAVAQVGQVGMSRNIGWSSSIQAEMGFEHWRPCAMPLHC